MVRHTKLSAALACALFLILAGAASAAPCRLALLLALDVSSSVDSREDRLQREGLAAALLSEDVSQVILNSPAPVALAVFEWSGTQNQTVQLPWIVIETVDDLVHAAETIRTSQRIDWRFPTALGRALEFAAHQFSIAPPCDAQTLDIAGDGINNSGLQPHLAYQDLPLGNVTINGLVILGDMPGLRDYFRYSVIQGPGAFVEAARGYEDFENAMRRKLLRELTVQILGRADTVAPQYSAPWPL